MKSGQGAKLSEAEFRANLNRFGLTMTEACAAVYFETRGVVIKPETIYKTYERGKSLSAPLSAVFIMLFNRYEKRRKNHATKAA